ncbi:hypothetical protein [Streptomyces sp. NPDC053755]|uniref:hypothetical protein n=1 Tax=Streptomyces sp. NPDC053755 TaxID=3155815 RepID=UPI0034300DFC
MTTDAHPPTSSRITEALLPPTPPAPAPSRPADDARPSTPPGSSTALPSSRTSGAYASGPSAPENAPPHPAGPPRMPGSPPSRPGGAPSTGRGGGRPGVPPQPAEAPAVETTARLRPIRGTGPSSGTAPRPGTTPAARQPDAPRTPGGPRRPEHATDAPRTPSDPRRPEPPRPAAPPGPAYAGSARPEAEWPEREARPEQAYGTYGAYRAYTVPPETLTETTTRLRPIRERRVGRVAAAGVCLVVGLGLIGGAAAGAVLAASDVGEPPEPPGFSLTRTLWHNAPVDTLFPRTLKGPEAGPGGAARTWTRVVVAPDAPCSAAVLPRSVLTALRPAGCDRVLRATYTDATASSVITVGMAFTPADPATMRSLGGPLIGDDVPPPLSAPGTVAERFGAGQRASWWTRALPDLPVVVFSVSGFADGRSVSPEPAAQAMTADRTTAPAQAGLGHEAKGVADGVERGLRTTVAAAVTKDDDR